MEYYKSVMWRPVLTGYVHSFAEVRDNWSIDELFDCLEQIDMKNDLECEQHERANQKGGFDG